MKKYKTEIIIALIVLLLSVSIIGIIKYTKIFSYTTKNVDIKSYQSNELHLKFDYPQNWHVVKNSNDDAEVITLSNADNSFNVYITGRKLNSQVQRQRDEIYSRNKYSFTSGDLETITVIDDKFVVVSKLGGVNIENNNDINGDSLVVSNIKLHNKYSVYEEHEDIVYTDLAIYDYKTNDVQLTIQYQLDTEDAINHLNEYMFMLSEIIDSIQPIDNDNSKLFSQSNEWQIYQSNMFGLSFDYPASWNVVTTGDDINATITLNSDADNSLELQIFKITATSDGSRLCEFNTPCDNAYPRTSLKYDESNFEKITTVDNTNIYIKQQVIDSMQGKLYSKKGDLLYTDLPIYSYSSDDTRLEIIYNINDDIVVTNWQEYITEISKIINSIK